MNSRYTALPVRLPIHDRRMTAFDDEFKERHSLVDRESRSGDGPTSRKISGMSAMIPSKFGNLLNGLLLCDLGVSEGYCNH